MKIECPSCKLSGNINDAAVPATGIGMTCPKCKTHFTVERPVAGEGLGNAMVDNCPSCQYATFSEEKFSTCPKCGLVVGEYLRQQLAGRGTQKSRPQPPPNGRAAHEQPLAQGQLSLAERKKEEEALKKYGFDKLPAAAAQAEPIALRGGDTPLSIMIVGWTTVIVAILLVVYGSSGLLEYAARLKEAKTALLAGEEALSMGELFLKFALFPIGIISYSLGMLFFGSQFLLLRRWALKALAMGAWAGIGLAAVMELTDMVAWCRRASDNASLGYYATGILGGALLAALWILPLLVLAEYLKSEQFAEISNSFR